MNIKNRTLSVHQEHCKPSRHGASSPAHGVRGDEGFTLLELIIVIVILGVLAAVALPYFSTDSAKGKALFQGLASVSHDASHFGVSLATYPVHYETMTNKTFGVAAANNTAGIALTTTWDGPYAKPADTDSAGDLVLNQVATGVTVTFAPVTPAANGLPNGLPFQYAVVANNVPLPIANAAVNACNGQSGNTGAASGGLCTLKASGTTAQVYYVFAQNQYGAY